jgi:putative FmdB family regulatory protein
MPFYEYQCSACHHQLEVMQKVDAPRLKKCPNCGKSTLTRLISAPVFRLAGSGWYETDFKSDKENKRNLVGEKESEPSAAGKDPTAKVELKDKPDAKSDAKADSAKDKATDSAKSGASESAKPAAGAKAGKAAATHRTVSRRPAAKAPARKAAPKGKRR